VGERGIVAPQREAGAGCTRRTPLTESSVHLALRRKVFPLQASPRIMEFSAKRIWAQAGGSGQQWSYYHLLTAAIDFIPGASERRVIDVRRIRAIRFGAVLEAMRYR